MSGSGPGGPSRRLIVVWVALAMAAAAIVLVQRNDRATIAEEGVADERALLPVPISDIGAVEVLNRGILYRFERDDAGKWFYHGIHAEAQAQHGHVTDPVAAERIDKALIGFGRTRKEREFPLNVQADEFGVTRPEIFIMTFLPKSTVPLSRYAVGIVAPDNVSRYILAVGSSTVVTIPDYHIENLLNLIASFEPGASAGTPTPATR